MAQLNSGLKGQINWPVIQGDDWSIRYQIKVSGVAIASYSGYTFVGHIRKIASKTSPVIAAISFNTAEGSGWVTQSVGRNLTQFIEPGNYAYEVEFINPQNKLRTLFGGVLTVSPQTALSANLVI